MRDPIRSHSHRPPIEKTATDAQISKCSNCKDFFLYLNNSNVFLSKACSSPRYTPEAVEKSQTFDMEAFSILYMINVPSKNLFWFIPTVASNLNRRSLSLQFSTMLAGRMLHSVNIRCLRESYMFCSSFSIFQLKMLSPVHGS